LFEYERQKKKFWLVSPFIEPQMMKM